MSLGELRTLSQRYLEINSKRYKRDFLNEEKHFKHRLSILLGQRGIGKTTLLAQYLLQKANHDLLNQTVLYIPCDHFLLANFSLYEIADEFSAHGGLFIAFDEIHKYSDWSKELKSIYDTFPSLKILASGSSALEIHKGSHDLTRRAAIHSLEGLSFREYLELNLNISLEKTELTDLLTNHEKITLSIKKKLKNKNILNEFSQYIKTGYYPYFLEIKDEDIFYTTIEQNFHQTIESDLTSIFPSLTGHSVKKIKQLLGFIAKSVPFTPNMQKLKSILEIGDERTLKTYLKYLEDASLIRCLMKNSKKINLLEAPEKIYLHNTNQLYAISKNAENIGTVRESFFLTMLSHDHKVSTSKNGDFIVDKTIVFEIGGKNKDASQIKNIANAYLACDGIERGVDNKIPLWLFGFLY